MPGAHDDRLLDALAAIAPVAFDGALFRVARAERSPFDGSRGAGRWNPSALSVLYCSDQADGALSEIWFHLNRGQPVFPSKLSFTLHELRARTERTLKFASLDALAALGVDKARWKELLYDRTQAIGAAAAFLGYDGLIAPSARHASMAVVLFLDNFDLNGIDAVGAAPVDWRAWRGRTP